MASSHRFSPHTFSPLRAVRACVAWFSRTKFFRTVGPTVMPPLERAIRFVSRGRVQMSGLLVPSLVLRTTGAKSGLERETELMYCPEPGSRMLVTGSNFARDTHPAWTANLIANPDAVAVVRGKPIRVRAELIGDQEREDVWAYIQRQWPGYRGYERASGRVLRIFRLTPIE
jgi:deazaflavin-dependent oxidoreductase (nitroreductase family)